MMNQPVDSHGKGKLYSSMADCGIQTIRNEGALAVYKGFFAQWSRVGPHTTISLVAWEALRHLFGFMLYRNRFCSLGHNYGSFLLTFKQQPCWRNESYLRHGVIWTACRTCKSC